MRRARIKEFIQYSVTNRFITAVLFGMLGIFLFFMLIGSVLPDKLNVEVLSPSPKTVHSPKTVEDKEGTKRKEEEAAKNVPDQYQFIDYREEHIAYVSAYFSAAQKAITELKANTEDAYDSVSNDKKVKTYRSYIEAELGKQVTDSDILLLMNESEKELEKAKTVIVDVINKLLKERITGKDLAEKKLEARYEISKAMLNKELQEFTSNLVERYITPNYFFDAEQTRIAKNTARKQIDPVLILQGQVIVTEGEIVTKEIYDRLEEVGVLHERNTLIPYFGLFLMLSVYLFILGHFFRVESSRLDNYKPNLLIFILIIVVTFVIMKICSLYQSVIYFNLGFIVPVAMATMLVKIILTERLALMMSLIISLGAGFMFNEGMSGSINATIFIYVLLSGIAGTAFLKKKNRKTTILRTGFLVAFVNLVLILSLSFLRNTDLTSTESVIYSVMALLSGVLSSILTLGLLPLLEDVFGFVSNVKLTELSNPSHPLIRKILMEAPGTYHHSIMVANLAEACCEAIGANGLLARVGSYYHDIGKTEKPLFFIENQLNTSNPHDQLAPLLSAKIIISHVEDGVNILEKYRMPKEIVDIAAQHHGTTFLKYFYYKAKKENEEVNEFNYRYPGPKAQTKEAAVVGIVDSVEAAVRSMKNPTKESISALVSSIITERIQDGQFSECDLTFKELEIIKQTSCEMLTGLFHNRIEYPKDTIKENQNGTTN